ncbi:MAG TPA: GAF domain-containing protein [Gaiellaceae bacterium]|nr:GAF domain-containing protein [Gaiellaceae bacterium]
MTSHVLPHELLEAVLRHLRDGIRVVDASGAPVFENDAAAERGPGAAAETLELDDYTVMFFRDGSGEAADPAALLDALYGSAPVGLGFWDRDLRYVRVNEALAQINERTPEDHIGKTIAEVVPQLEHVLVPLARNVLETGEPVIALELSAGTPNDPEAPRHWRASYYPVVAPDGQRVGVGAVVEETTDRRRAEQLSELQHAVTRVLAEAAALDDAVPRVLETICTSLGWDVACFWWADAEAPRITWTRPGAHVEGFLALTERLDLSPALLPGRVAASGETEWLANLEPEMSPRTPVAFAEGLRSGFAIPVRSDGEIAGVVEAFTKVQRDPDEELVPTLEAIGVQLGQFIRRTRVEEERTQLLQRERAARAEAEAAAATLRKLERVADAALQHISLQDLLDALLRRIVEVLDADTASILLVGDDGHLHLRATFGLENEARRALAIPIGEGMAGRVAASRASLLVPDLSEVELVSPVLRERGINSVVAIPLIVEDRVIGVMHAGSEALAQFVDADARLLELIADRIALAINQAALHDAERVAQERLQFLGEASALLASSLDVEETLTRAVQLAVPHFADWCAVDIVQPNRRLERLAIAHVDPERIELAQRLAAAFPASLDDARGVGAIIRSRTPVLSNDIDADALRAAYGDQPEYLHALLALDLTATMVVPLVIRDRTLGAIILVSAESRRKYGPEDLAFAQELAARAAVAVDNAQLYREAALGRDRLGFLAEASALLGSSLDVERTLEQLRALVEGRVADRCAIHLVDDTPRPRPPAVERVVRSGEPELLAELTDEPDVRSCVVVPLQARGRTFGAMTLVWAESDRRYDAPDVEFALDLARRAAVAIDNAQLYGAAAERAQAARVLASVGDGVFLVDRAGVIRTWNRAAAAATGLPATDVVDRPATDAIPGWTAIASRVSVSVPGTNAPRPESLPLDVDGREIWLSVHGVAVPDGVVYAFRDLTEERALEQMRTEFVSTVSHELRTPLAAIYGAAMTLRRTDVALDEDQRAKLLDVVSGEADRLARIVNDILWASRLDTDSLHVSIQNCDPLALVHDVLQAQEAHLDRAHSLELATGDDLPLVVGDPDKVGRVLINLVDNAVKYSPDGGLVAVSVERNGSHVRFSVGDEGLGIPPSEQRRVFEKFYRLDPNMNRGVGGTGLGLYICRELVRRMDGRIWVESKGLGRGSTFHVELPAAPSY